MKRIILMTLMLETLTILSVFAGHIRVGKSPYSFDLHSAEDNEVTLGVIAVDGLEEPRLNGITLAGKMPTESSLVVRPDKKAVFSYHDLFLRNFRGRRQIPETKDAMNRPAEDFLNFPLKAKRPKFMLDIWQVNATHLCMNTREDILWWTGELIYKFDFAFPVISFKLESPDGRNTVIGDWEWERVGRAVKIFASSNRRDWRLIWQSHGKGGVTHVSAEIPPEMKNTKTVFIKFWGQNANVLFDLFITAVLDAKEALPLVRLKKGNNHFSFDDAPSSSHRAIIFWHGEGIRLLHKGKYLEYPPQKPVVKIRDNNIAILFPDRVGVWLSKEGETIRGIERITAGQKEILAPLTEGGRPPVMSVITGGEIEPVRKWKAYLEERQKKFGDSGKFPRRGGLSIDDIPVEGKFSGWHTEGKYVCISLNLNKGSAEWLFRPASEEINSKTYSGLKWKLRLKGIGRAYQIVVEEPVAFTTDDWRFAQVWGPFEEYRLGLLSEFHVPERGYFARQQPFFFIAGEVGAVVSFFYRTVCAGVSERREVDRLIVRSRIPIKADKIAETPEKLWLFCEGDFSSRWDALNEWTQVYDSLVGRYREMEGLMSIEPMPTLLWQSGWQAALWGRDYYGAAKAGLPQDGRWFYRLAEELPKLAQWGIRVLYLSGALESDADKLKSDFLPGSICFGSVCAPWRIEVSPSMGGEEGLKHLCEIAHGYGIKVVLWSTPAHLSNSSPLLLEHPEWLAWRSNGTPERCGYRDITGVSLRSGYFDYVVSQYEKIREATGFDGIWQDSFLTFGVLTDFAEPAPYPQLDETVNMQRRLQKMGCQEIHIEGCGPFGLSSGGMGYGAPDFFERINGSEYGLYYYIADTKIEPESYFRTLASKGIIGITTIKDFEKLSPDVKKQIIGYNLAYLKALPCMKHRRLIGDGDRWLGVEWYDEQGRKSILFVFEQIDWHIRRGANAYDLITNQKCTVANSILRAMPWHIYIQK